MNVVNAAKTNAEARQLLEDIVARLSTTQDADLPFALRTALHACNLLGWSDAADWILKEIKGHDGTTSVPPHRYVTAYAQWRPYAMHDIIEQVVAARSKVEPREQVAWVLLAGIDQLVQNAQNAVIVREQEEEERWFNISKKSVKGRRVTVVESAQTKQCLVGLQNELFRWASQSCVAVRAGDVASDLWSAKRAAVDEFLSQIGFANHLKTIEEGLSSAEPQRWREAMWSSRDLLHDVAQLLWRDNRQTYTHLQDDAGKDIEVTAGKFVNRLMAYMHQKGITGTSGAYLRSEFVRLRHLTAFASSQHDKDAVSLEDARSVFFAVYWLLGELVDRTDGQPVEEYK